MTPAERKALKGRAHNLNPIVTIGGKGLTDAVVAEIDLALKAHERALEPKRLVMIKGGHFDPYLGGFETASRAAIDWFETHV